MYGKLFPLNPLLLLLLLLLLQQQRGRRVMEEYRPTAGQIITMFRFVYFTSTP